MKSRFYLGMAAIALVAPMTAHAQETTSSIRGTVTAEGAPVAGAGVSIVHTPSGTTSSATTAADGSFVASGLRVGGPFTVSVSADGFEDGQVTDVFLTAGQPFRLPVQLAQASEIVVTAAATSAVNLSNGPITSLGRTEIEGVASISRDIRDLARRDPFVTMDPTNSRTIEIAGTNGRLNRFSVDGVQFSDDFGLNNGGLPTSRGPVPFDAIEQLSIKVAPFDISEGDFQGGAINVVLRSGTNDFSGSAFFDYSDDSLTGDRSRGRDIALDFDSKHYGGLLAGPIIKDKLFFMIAYEKLEEKDPFDDGVGPGFANQVPGITLDQIDQVSQIAESVYGYDTLGLIQNATEEDEKIVGKLDWNINDDHRASLTYIRNVGTQQFQQNAFLTPQFALGLQSNGYELAEEVNTGVFQLNSNWSDNFSTEFRASYRDYNRDQTPFGGRDFAQMEVCLDQTSVTNLPTNSVTTCGSSRLFFGPDVSRHANDLNTENLSLDFTARATFGDHAIKFLAGYTDVSTFNLFVQRSLGDIYFDSLADFQAARASRFRLGGAVPSLDVNDAAASFNSQNITVGIQDDWDVTPELQFTFAARYDLFNNNPYPPLNPNFLARYGFSNRETFSGKGVFQPRFGFNWQPMDRLVLRGGIGIFAGGTPDVFLSNSYSNTGLLTNQIDLSRNTSAAGCNVPTNTGLTPAQQAAICAGALNGVTGSSFPSAVTDFLATNTAALAAAPVNAIDPDLKVARKLRGSLSADYEADLGALGDGWTFGADFLYSNDVYAYTWTDLRSVPIGVLPDGRTRYGPRNGPTTNQDLLMTNDTRGRSYIGVARFSKAWDWGLTIDGSYTRSDVKDANALTSATAGSLYNNNAFLDPNIAAYGTSIYQIKDQWKFSFDYRHAFFGENETRFSLFGEYRSGRPYSITMNDSTNRSVVFGTVGNGGRQLLYVPTGTSDPLVAYGDTVVNNVVTQTAAQARDLLDAFISGNGLNKFRGGAVAKNSQQAPDFFKVDLHIAQQIPTFVGDSKVELFADIENFLNLLDSDWGSLRQVAFPQTAPVVNVACVAAPAGQPANPCAQYRYSNFTAPNESLVGRSSLYQIRVGVRFEF